MKYKVGDKFLQEIEVGRIVEHAPCPYKMLPDCGGWSEAALNELRRPDDMTAEEAWEIAKKLFADFKNHELDEIFGKDWSYLKLMNLSPRQAKAKIEAWEAEKEIEVGDIVHFIDKPEIKVMITVKHESGYYNGINAGGSTYSGMNGKYWKKTGRHIDIQSLLKQIGGTE